MKEPRDSVFHDVRSAIGGACPVLFSTLTALMFGTPTLVSQEVEARENLAEAVRRIEAGAALEAARALRDADLRAGAIEDEGLREELHDAIVVLAKDVDPLFEKRRELDREFAGRFFEIASKLLAAGLPRTAKLAVDDAVKFDPVLVEDLQDRVEAEIAGQDKDSALGRLDLQSALLLAFTAEFDDAADRARELHTDLPAWLDARFDATEALRKLALTYRRKKRLELAYDVARLGFGIYRNGIREEFRELHGEVLAQRAKARYEQLARPHMDEFRRGNQKLGGSKRWRFDGMVIEAPPPTQRPAVLVSKRRLAGSYRIEIDLQLVKMIGEMELVVAWRDADDYCVLEFERPRASYSWIRIVHVEGGRSRTLAEAQAAQTLGAYFPLRAEVSDGRVEVGLGDASCHAVLPIDTSEGVAFGLIRPALTREPEKRDREEVIRIRNLVITEL